MTETTVTTRQALDALRAELNAQLEPDPYFRFRHHYVFHTAWAEMWRGGMWIAQRVGDSARATSLRAAMSEAELEEFNMLSEHYGTDITTRQALDALKAELKTQRERDQNFRFRRDHKFKTAWVEIWRGGSWITARVGDGEQARSKRASMSEDEREDFNRLLEHYGRPRQ